MDTDMKACRCPNLMIISYYTGYIIMAVGVLNLISLIISLLLAEWNPALDFAISFSLTDIVGLLMVLIGYPAHKKQDFVGGLVGGSFLHKVGNNRVGGEGFS